jgi:hypothetical protein
MSDGALRIPITGDASQFKATLAEIESSLKYFKEKLKSAKGDQVAKINFTIAGLEESKTAITTFGKFAEGTLGALNQQISELNRKKLTIQADAAALAPINQELDRLIKKRDELNKAGLAKPIIESVRPAAESIAGLRLRIQELNDLKILIDPKLNPSALAKINQEIDILEDKVSNLDNLGNRVGGATGSAAGGLKKFEDQSRQSRIAVTNLALVLQDLPFGFIAIQNNLPNLQSSFANLKTTSNGTKEAFKAFAGALAGPGGFFLAFSAITAAVTYAVQKYGSIGAAIDALTGKYVDLGGVVNRAAESLKKYNENQITSGEIATSAEASQAGQILRIRTLANAVLDLSKSENVRKKALDELKKLDEPRFKNFDIEKGKIEGLSGAVQEYTRAIIAQAVAQKFTDQVSTTTVELEKQRNALGTVLTQLDKYGNFQEKIKRFRAEQAQTAALGGVPRAANDEERTIEALIKKRQELEAGIVTLATQLNEYNVSAQNATLTATSLASGLKESTKATKNVTKATKEYKEELSKVVPLFDMFQIKEKKTKQGLFFDFLEGLFSKNDLSQLKEAYKRIQDAQKEIDKFREAEPKLPDVDPIKRLQGKIDESEAFRKGLAEDFEGIKQTLQDVFFTPVSDLFDNFFETGKFAFDEFGKSILKTIKSLVSRIIATGIINLLANILFPGGGTASSALGGSATGAGGGILGAFGAAFKSVLGIGKISNPNFGGVQGGGMQLAGEVVFRQRGSDLIGVINRTNGTINRVG